MKKIRRSFLIALCLLAAFVLWTVALCFVDVAAIGPGDSAVGFAALNRAFHHLTGVHMGLYTVTDWLGLVPIFLAMGFAALGFVQLLRGQSIRKVDYSILVLGGFYAAVAGVYFLFEALAVNYRPVLIEGILEVSYPSSTTMLALCVMPTAMMQFRERIRHPALRCFLLLLIAAFTVFMVIGRLLSGVHWLTDIIGGTILSGGLVMLYAAVVSIPSISES